MATGDTAEARQNIKETLDEVKTALDSISLEIDQPMPNAEFVGEMEDHAKATLRHACVQTGLLILRLESERAREGHDLQALSKSGSRQVAIDGGIIR